MTGSQALFAAIGRLRNAGIDDPARDARRLLAHAIGTHFGRLTLVLPDAMTDLQVENFDTLIQRRTTREPVSHLIGVRAFFGREFDVSPSVLDPRPETEILIEQALKIDFANVLDLGTGSGCILLTLLGERPNLVGHGTDLSDQALVVAAQNARKHSLETRATFSQSAWFEAIPSNDKYDLIVSNPPYIALDEMPGLAPELSFEPRSALTDEGDGLSAYRDIAIGAKQYLTDGGCLMVEIGPTQAADVSALFVQNGFDRIVTHTDLDSRDRVVSGVFSPQTN